jgi:hypothetical protein
MELPIAELLSPGLFRLKHSRRGARRNGRTTLDLPHDWLKEYSKRSFLVCPFSILDESLLVVLPDPHIHSCANLVKEFPHLFPVPG